MIMHKSLSISQLNYPVLTKKKKKNLTTLLNVLDIQPRDFKLIHSSLVFGWSESLQETYMRLLGIILICLNLNVT